MGRTSLGHSDFLALELFDGGQGGAGGHEYDVTTGVVGVGGDDLDLRVRRRTEDRGRVTGDGEVDLARGGGLDLGRTRGERRELDLERQRIEFSRSAHERFGTALLVADAQRQAGQLCGIDAGVGDGAGRILFADTAAERQRENPGQDDEYGRTSAEPSGGHA